MDADLRMVRHESSGAGWDSTDFENYRRALNSGNERAAVTVILKLVWLPNSRQRNQAIEILGNRTIPAAERSTWLYVFSQWAKIKDQGGIATKLLSSSNPDVAQLARQTFTS